MGEHIELSDRGGEAAASCSRWRAGVDLVEAALARIALTAEQAAGQQRPDQPAKWQVVG